MKVSIFWFRRDLRTEDNIGLYQALSSPHPVLPLFIFDEDIINELPADDARVNFIYEQLQHIHSQLEKTDSSLLCLKGQPLEIWKHLVQEYDIDTVYINRDYEPYALQRDKQIQTLLEQDGIAFKSFKDQVIFEKNDILKNDGKPYTVFTPYKNKWLSHFDKNKSKPLAAHNTAHYLKVNFAFPSLKDMGLKESKIKVKPYTLRLVDHYDELRNFPAVDATSYLSPHLRFGTVSIRQIIYQLKDIHESFLSELIWREFFMQILYHFPQVVTQNFKKKYDHIQWRNNPEEFEKWCEGKTGYPMVDAGMRELNQTGYMHNRVRMVVASFLCKHLLIDWRWGEAYFAKKLLDYELSSNNGNWQWAAGTGCDAAPYFRVFNPSEQLKKFDKDLKYIHKWIPEFNGFGYPEPIVDHKMARQRALDTYKVGLESYEL